MSENPADKVVRLSISLPPDLDKQIRKYAQNQELSVSAFFREAALLKLRTTVKEQPSGR